MALTQIMMANSITSLRAIARMDWETFVERQSAMEAVLRQDPAGVYAADDVRDPGPVPARGRADREADRREEEPRWRGARWSWRRAAGGDGATRGARTWATIWWTKGSPSSSGRPGYRPPPGSGSTAGHCAIPTWCSWAACCRDGGRAAGACCGSPGPDARAAWPLVLLFALIPANDIAVSAMNQLLTAFLPPRRLPKLDLAAGGVPAELRTAVVVPTLFGSVEAVREALEHLEVQYLANREAHLQFAILSDFTDRRTETRDGDAADPRGRRGRHRGRSTRATPRGARTPFFLFHRARRWNPQPGRVDGLGAEAW